MTEDSGIIDPKVPKDATLLEAAKQMVSNQSSDVFVVDAAQQPVGVVRMLDIVWAVSEGLPKDTRVEEVMLRPLPTVEEEATVEEVAVAFRKSGVNRILVKHDKEIVGMVEAGEMFAMISSSQRTVEVFKAVSVRARLRMAELLSVMPMSVDELADELGIKPGTVRHHLDVLRRNGMIEELQQEGLGKVGRPLSLFRTTDSVLKRYSLPHG